MNAQPSLQTRIVRDDTRSETALVTAARNGSESAVRELIRRLNPRLFRVARGIVSSDAEAEDVVQDTYLVAFNKLDSFRAEASFTTWITRIAINAARMRLRRHHPSEVYDTVTESDTSHVLDFPGQGSEPVEATILRAEIRRLIEKAVAELPPDLRLVFMLRETEGLSTAATADQLQINKITVKTRLFRARFLLRAALQRKIRGGFEEIFPFDGKRCADMAKRVVAALKADGTL
ncbi:RNA polymerase sigma factor [Seohaeicola zhoushanensis]|uniref:RNA polymerase sigma factor n=1 Tax=Seohaeicola zhoushanensis TaxID=1569283 RepID=A0A8J3GVA8_9RHOB|nr:RNA polymerase sigma factor [Seohaeicola zhoushanensis]GHF38485.1 RNA polymerase sigma factor [Seohaeicola zhoushanensis]